MPCDQTNLTHIHGHDACSESSSSDDSDSESDDDDGMSRRTNIKTKEPCVCPLCNQTGHNERSHHLLCSAPVCDRKSHKRPDQHTSACILRPCHQRGHTTASHPSLCSCGQRGHTKAQCGSVHDAGSGHHKHQVCGFNGHTRSNTPACPFYHPTRKKRLKATFRRPVISVVKMAWNSFRRARELDPAVEAFVRRQTQIVREASLLMNAFWMWCIERSAPLPDFSNDMNSRKFINRVFSYVSADDIPVRASVGSNADLERLAEFVREWWAPRVPSDHTKASRRNMSQALNIAADGYRVAMMNYVTTTLHGRIKRYALWRVLTRLAERFGRADAVPRKVSSSVAGHWLAKWTSDDDDRSFSLPPHARSAIERVEGASEAFALACTDVMSFLDGISLDSESVERRWYDYFRVLARISAAFAEHRREWVAEVDSWKDLDRKTRNRRFAQDPRSGKLLKPFSMLPHHSHQAKYVTIDIEVLKSLWKESGSPAVACVGSEDELWDMSFRLPRAETANRKFDMRLSTDGISVSIQCLRERGSDPDDGASKFPPPEFLAGMSKIVTLDEGRIDLYAGVCSDIPSDGDPDPDPDRETVIRLSNKEYQTRSGNRGRTMQRNAWRRGCDVADIEADTPPRKVVALEEYDAFVAYHFAHVRTLLDFYGSRRWRRLRFDAYCGTKRIREVLCDELIERCGVGSPDGLIAVFGAAKFDHASAGHAASTRGNWVRKGLRQRGAYVPADLNEYKTSQRCSKCMGELDKKSKVHWQVKTCKQVDCLTTWNRDVNAARSFRKIWLWCVRNGGERPEPFEFPSAARSRPGV